MKWVVLGDLCRRDLYHLGDDAMTEVAIEMLRERGASQITVVAADPGFAAEFYGCPAVSRIGFGPKEGYAAREHRLAGIVGALERGDAPAEGSVAAALRDADFALVAGSGSMTSQYSYLLSEIHAFARIADHFDVPLFVAAQTVGPKLRPADAAMVEEVLDTAVSFAARESRTAELLRPMAERRSGLVHTFDDAVLLRARDDDRDAVAALGLDERVIVASFTADQGTSGIERADYVARLAELLDGLAERHDAQVALVPHMGSFLEEFESRDQILNAEIAARSRSGRLRAMPMLTARRNVALVERSLGSVASRYHPVVFGPQAGVPTVAVSLSLYSSVRMRGGMQNFGLERWVVPSALWERIADACDEAFAAKDRFAAHLEGPGEQSVEAQTRWWDAVAHAARTGEWAPPADVVPAPVLVPEGDWSAAVEAATPVFEGWMAEAVERGWVEKERARWQRRAEGAEGRRAVRVLDRLTGMVRR